MASLASVPTAISWYGCTGGQGPGPAAEGILLDLSCLPWAQEGRSQAQQQRRSCSIRHVCQMGGRPHPPRAAIHLLMLGQGVGCWWAVPSHREAASGVSLIRGVLPEAAWHPLLPVHRPPIHLSICPPVLPALAEARGPRRVSEMGCGRRGWVAIALPQGQDRGGNREVQALLRERIPGVQTRH